MKPPGLSGRVNHQAGWYKIANLIEAISDGRASPAILGELAVLEIQRTQLNEQEGRTLERFRS